MASWCEFCVHGVRRARFKATHSFYGFTASSSLQRSLQSSCSHWTFRQGATFLFDICLSRGDRCQKDLIASLISQAKNPFLCILTHLLNYNYRICCLKVLVGYLKLVLMGAAKPWCTTQSPSTGSQIWQIGANLRLPLVLDLANFRLPHTLEKSPTINAVEHI